MEDKFVTRLVDVKIGDFERKGILAPVFWSDRAVGIAARTYFTPDENSIFSMVDRVAIAIVNKGIELGYFTNTNLNADKFLEDLTTILLHQEAAFNTPVWINVGVPNRDQQAWACAAYDTLMLTDRGLEKIGSIANSNDNTASFYTPNGWSKGSAWQTGNRKVVSVTLSNGLSIITTPDHKFVIGDTLEEAQNLQGLKLEPFYGNGDWDGIPSDYSIELLEKLGYLQGDGSPSNEGWVAFFGEKDKDVLAKFANDEGIERPSDKIGLYFGKNSLISIQASKLGMQRCSLPNRDLPEWLYTESPEKMCAFLRGLYSANGSISTINKNNSARISLRSTCYKLMANAQKMLLALGIKSNLKFKKPFMVNWRNGNYTSRLSYDLEILSKSSISAFADKIGFIQQYKIYKLEAAVNATLREARYTPKLTVISVEDIPETVDVYDFSVADESHIGWANGLAIHNCLILGVNDDMASIKEGWGIEAKTFENGSGSGVNVSRIRANGEPINGGGWGSGPISLWMRPTDSIANVVKSGGKSRRAAKMVVMDIDHPEIRDFVETKVVAENMSRDLLRLGYDIGMTGKHSPNIPFQQANNSVRVTDAFMKAVENDEDWNLLYRTSGEIASTVNARELWAEICQAAWDCGDPGIQFHDTINKVHPCLNDGEQRSTNPCVTGDTLILTKNGINIPIIDLVNKENIQIMGSDGKYHYMLAAFKTGTKLVYQLKTEFGRVLKLTADHLVSTKRGDVAAVDLVDGDYIQTIAPINTSKYVSTTSLTWDKFVSLELIGEEDVYDLTEPITHHFIANGIVVHNCSEYSWMDNTVCNLSSINLMKFWDPSGAFQVARLRAVVDTMTVAMDILCDLSSYPTEKIGETSKSYRTLGLGFTNLGSLLMSSGIPYNSEIGRQNAASIQAIIQGQAVLTSQYLAEQLSPYPRYEANVEHQIKVLQDQKSLALSQATVFNPLTKAAEAVWSEVRPENPVRNAQSTVIAPTGTISLLMDCETTGIEPVLAFDAIKTLSTSGSLDVSVSECISNGLVTLRTSIGDFDSPDSTIIERFFEVFQTALGDNAVSPIGHVLMMAAVQPYVSGAISKTVNCPNDWTPEQISNIYFTAWHNGVKAIAVFRDGCKAYQPNNVKKAETTPVAVPADFQKLLVEMMTKEPQKEIVYVSERKRPPKTRYGTTHKFDLMGEEFYLTVNFYPDGQPCEIFIKNNKHGSAIGGWVDAFSISVSMGLQYGVPIENLISHFRHMNFAPQGMVISDSAIKMADSPVDYIFRWLDKEGLRNIPDGGREIPEVTHTGEPVVLAEIPDVIGELTGESCSFCESPRLYRTGSCKTCQDCGSTTGCA